MNVLAQLLDKSKHKDGILPEYGNGLMSDFIASLSDVEFEMLTDALKVGAASYDLYNKKSKLLSESIEVPEENV